MKIKEIEIRSLFGYFHHKIPLRMKERITIIHGPNGVGKTTILRLVNDLFASRFYSLFAIPFDSIIIHFDPKGNLTVTRTKPAGAEATPKLTLTYRIGSKRTEHKVTLISEVEARKRFPLSMIERIIENLERIGPSEWRDEITGKSLSLGDVLVHYGHLLPSDFRSGITPVPEEITNLLKGVHIALVETQRLFTEPRVEDASYTYHRRSEGPTQRMTVEQYSEDMIQRIQNYQREAGVLGASLDSTYPHRILRADLPDEATEQSIRKLYSMQSEYRDRLMKAGVIAAETPVSLPAGGLTENERKVLWIYLDDVEHKLKVFDPLLRRVELFKDIVNSRFSYKKFGVDREKGFIFKSNYSDSVVPPRALSSGEQHEIVLTYQLLFKAQAGSLIFIDEPELSLHVTWQRKFLEDIGRISELADLDFLVATHSPSIINNRRDLMVKLASEKEA